MCASAWEFHKIPKEKSIFTAYPQENYGYNSTLMSPLFLINFGWCGHLRLAEKDKFKHQSEPLGHSLLFYFLHDLGERTWSLIGNGDKNPIFCSQCSNCAKQQNLGNDELPSWFSCLPSPRTFINPNLSTAVVSSLFLLWKSPIISQIISNYFNTELWLSS